MHGFEPTSYEAEVQARLQPCILSIPAQPTTWHAASSLDKFFNHGQTTFSYQLYKSYVTPILNLHCNLSATHCSTDSHSWSKVTRRLIHYLCIRAKNLFPPFLEFQFKFVNTESWNLTIFIFHTVLFTIYNFLLSLADPFRFASKSVVGLIYF